MKYKHYGPLWYRALRAVHFGAIGGLVYVTAAGFIISYVLSPVWVRQAEANGYNAFSPASFWAKPLPKYPTLHPGSASIVAQLVQQVGATGSNFDTTDTSATVYEVGDDVALVPVLPWDCTGSGSMDDALAAQWQQVPMPFYATASGAAIVYQPSTQSVWEFADLRKQNGAWQACSGGKISASTSNNGMFDAPYGITATGLARLAGQISIKELQTGTIQHAVGLSLPALNAAGLAWPAMNYRGGSTPSNFYPGLRLQLDPTLNVDSLGLPPITAMIAKAAQTYGFVVWDTSSQATVVGESPLSYTARGATNPYNALGAPNSSILAAFPWDKLQALPAGYGQFASSPSISTFSSSAQSIDVGDRLQLSWAAIEVSSCAIPGVTAAGPASGSVTTPPLTSATTYTLVCSGPHGSVSRQMSIAVVGGNANDPPKAVTTTTIASPTGVNLTVFPEFSTNAAAETVQKVIYYERDNEVQATTTPPFALDTSMLRDGKHQMEIKIRYRDGREEQRVTTIHVANKPQPLELTTSAPSLETQSIPPVLAGLGIAGSMMTTGLTGWIGWRRT